MEKILDFFTRNSEIKQLFTNIKKLNKEIQNLDNIRKTAENRLQFIINSDNAALGNVPDINFRANTVIIENILLILVAFIILVLSVIPKVKKVVETVEKKQ
ncbi:MAG: hypothetical protein HRS57_03640 [Mycoplasmataceae bacterium]|nr:hypothetical protein [Mycoplasmataceae bacterium]